MQNVIRHRHRCTATESPAELSGSVRQREFVADMDAYIASKVKFAEQRNFFNNEY